MVYPVCGTWCVRCDGDVYRTLCGTWHVPIICVVRRQIPEEDGVLVLDPSNFADAVAQVRYSQCGIALRYSAVRTQAHMSAVQQRWGV